MSKNHRTITILIVIMVALMTTASSCFDFVKPFKGTEGQDIVDELIEESQNDGQQPEESGSDTDQADAEEGPEDWYEPQVPYSEIYDDPRLGALDWAFNLLYPTATNEDRANLVFTIDPVTGELIYSIEGQNPGLYLPQVDQVGWGYMMFQFDDSWSGPPPDVVFPCDQDINNLPPSQDWITICPQGTGVSNGNSWYVVYSIFDAPIPWDDAGHSYTYAAIFDADGIPDNNFQFMEPYNWDYWQNTDQWYILDWLHDNQSWSFYAMDENREPFESNSRVVIHDNALFWIIPEDEFAVPQPGGRVSSFATTGGWDPADVGGDVNGNNPTEPLTPLDSDPIQVMDPPYTLTSVVLDDEWEICGSGQCKYNQGIAEGQKTFVWCTDNGCSNLGGSCSLFSRAKTDSPQDPESWSYVAGPNEKMQVEWDFDYHCYCVK